MKTYEIYGALPAAFATADESAANTTAVAVAVQRALSVEMFAREDEPYLNHSHAVHEGKAIRETFVLSNVAKPGESPPFPEFAYAVVVGVGEPADPPRTRAALEDMGLALLRRRRREYARSSQDVVRPSLEVYGAPVDAASVVALVGSLLGMRFDGNEHAVRGGDSHYYDESERFGTILVFDNVQQPYDDPPFPQYDGVLAVLIAANPRQELRGLLLSRGLTLLKTSGSEDEA